MTTAGAKTGVNEFVLGTGGQNRQMSSNGSGLNRPRSGEVMLKAHRRAVTSAATPNDALARHDRKRADELAAQVLEELPEGTAEIGVGSELAISRGAGTVLPFFNDTLTRPNLVSLDASNQRAELAGNANSLEMALDALETIRARNSAARNHLDEETVVSVP
jgi:hypothetical protein